MNDTVMGATPNTVSALAGYALTDRGTWLGFRNEGELVPLVGGQRLFNPYGVILVNTERHFHVKAADGQRFIDRLVHRRARWPSPVFASEADNAFILTRKGAEGRSQRPMVSSRRKDPIDE